MSGNFQVGFKQYFPNLPGFKNNLECSRKPRFLDSTLEQKNQHPK